MKFPLPPGLVGPLLGGIYRFWCATLRVSQSGREGLEAVWAEKRPMMAALWHDELFALMHVRGSLRLATVVSASRDGEYLARLLQSLGLTTVRGSSSRGGLGALLRMAKLLRKEPHIGVVTVDGPKGPRHKVKDGVIFLAFHTPAPIMPIRLFPQRAKVFRSWNRFQLPLPFSRVHIVIGEPYYLTATELTPEELDRERRVLQEKLEALKPPQDPRPKSAAGWKARAIGAIAAFMSRRSPHAMDRLAAFMGTCLWNLFPRRRDIASEAIARHLSLPTAEARRVARESFTQNCRSFLEIFHTGGFGKDHPKLRLADPKLFERLQNEPGPIVVATAHLGSWEQLAGPLGDILPGRPKMVVVRKHNDADVNRLMAGLRGARGASILDHRDAAREVLHGLKQNGLCAFLVDHNCSRKEAVFLPFIGETAAVNAGPAMLALRAKAVVYAVFLIRGADGIYTMHIHEPLRTEELTGTVGERVERIAEYYTRAVEEGVRRNPEQWFWMHRRWKTRPEGESE